MRHNDPRFDEDHDCKEAVANEAMLTPDGLCPMCDEARRVEEMEQEMHARRADPRMHPSVDAPRY